MSAAPRWRNRPKRGPRSGARTSSSTYNSRDGAPGVFDQKEEKFIGGAERARRNARKRQRQNGDFGPNTSTTTCKRWTQNRATNNSIGNNNGRDGTGIPKSIKPMDRFFASLFLSSVDEYIKSEDDDTARAQLMSDICVRARLPLPAKVPPSSIDAHHFYSTRASLVMEEARYIVADALRRQGRPHDPHGRPHDGPALLRLRLVSAEEREKLGATVLTFEKKPRGATFTPQELCDMRPGCCFEIALEGKVEKSQKEESDDYIPLDSANTWDHTSVLASVVPLADRSNVDSQLSLVIFHRLMLDPLCDEELWQIRPLTTLISECRQFEACTQKPNVAFLPKLLGWKDASHIRFDDSDDDDSDDGDNEEEKNPNEEKDDKQSTRHVASRLILPRLNPTQERAAAAYLASPLSTLMLVQGPPGTGKSTFTVSCIIRCLFQSTRDGLSRRILVTAPTNKAVTVLASRFLEALNGDNTFNVVMIGVEDKLVGSTVVHRRHHGKKEEDDLLALPSTLRDVFVYTWMDTIIESFQSVRNILCSEIDTNGLAARVRRLKKKLKGGIPTRYKESNAPAALNAFISCLEQSEPSLSETMRCLDSIVACLGQIDKSEATQELLANADVIFSTLSTAGVSAMKQTRRVTDVFVDEAAAATEPEICIPFHLRPERMLAVGDPMQLPATIMSKSAAAFGLDRSLHERLMYGCGKEHIMLDTQYRMKPDISLFPSRTFYNGKLMNGDNVVTSTYGHRATMLRSTPFTFRQTSGSERQYASGSYCNDIEAQAVVELLEMLRAAANTQKNGPDRTPWHSPDRIRVITFYQAQVSLIQRFLVKNGLGQVLVTTVDACQGCEADVVILSFVRSNDKRGSAKHTLGFLTDDRRLNVALTRARYQLICVGNATGTLSAAGTGTTLANFVNHAKERRCILPLEA
mmetsp:Transcript_26326/g.58503  ORF Transcript_26326/g.58503 Transcript_26326/m.58503 type:complete len:922 (+) Transcript_26326:139-2904(+)